MKSICENIKSIENTIRSIQNAPIELVAVTKTFSSKDVLEALKCQIKHIGESKVQEALPKFEQLGSYLNYITKHFVGHLQSNKVKKIVSNFDLIHSLDSLGLAASINKYAKSINKIQGCLIEVKISQETTKTGVNPDIVHDFYEQCFFFSNLLIKGLMVIAPYNANPKELRPYFKQAYNLFESIKESFRSPAFNVLSMGMSNDYKIAIEEGSNMVRIGSAIFGDRNYGNK